jgi:hypothetical protein
MTQSDRPPDRSPDRLPDRQFARDVAKQLDRRHLRRRMTLWSALLALVAAAAMYLRCGNGLGLGGLAGGGGQGEQQPLAGPRRCAVRIAASGITVDGRPMTRADAVSACKAAGGAEVTVTGDARHGDRQALLAALHAAGVQGKDLVIHEPTPPSGAPPGAPEPAPDGSGDIGRN